VAKFRFISGNSGQIVATEDIPVHGVRRGQLGGIIKPLRKTDIINLSKDYQQNAWITQGALAMNCQMYGNSIIESKNMDYGKYDDYLGSHVIVQNTIMHDNSKVTSESFLSGIEDHFLAVSVEQCSMFGNSIISTGSQITGMQLIDNDHARLVFSNSIGSYREIEAMSFRFCGVELDEYEIPLFRIQATRDIPTWGVKKGDLGGLADSMTVDVANVFRPILEDDSWFDYNSIVKNSVISGKSFVGGGAFINGCHINQKSYIHGNVKFRNCVITKNFSLNCLILPKVEPSRIQSDEFSELYFNGSSRLNCISTYADLNTELMKYIDIYSKNYMSKRPNMFT